jgi:hypothetical protein
MSGKSIDDILRQQMAQRQAQIQAQQAQERAINEQRERQRQEYLERSRMFEALSNISTAAASAAAGGKVVTQQVDFPEVIGQSQLVTWKDEVTNTWKIVVYNFTTGVLSDIIDTELIGDDWNNNTGYNHVQNKGFSAIYRNNVDDKYKIYFLNASGTLVGTKDLDTNEDFQYTENAQIFLGNLEEKATVHHFTGDNVRTHIFDMDASDVEVDDGTAEDVAKDGSIIIEAPNNERFYNARPNGDLVEITDYLLGNNNFRTDYALDYISTYKNGSIAEYEPDGDLEYREIKIISQEGELINQLNYGEGYFSILNQNTYGDDCTYWEFNIGDDGEKKIVSYDVDSDQFVTLEFPESDFLFGRSEEEWDNPYSSIGNNLVVATYDNLGGDSLGYITPYLILHWLPKGASEFITHDVNLGTVSYIDGTDDFTSYRTFTDGENPLIMFGLTSSEIQIGFLTPTGFLTQSTGIQYASCSNIWGHNIGDKSFAVFDITDGSRVWQIYDENSIIEETTTTDSWEFGYNSRQAHRNGTLVVLDSGTTSNSFIYTTEVGLTAGPTGIGEVYNRVEYANRTGRSLSEQVIVQYVPGQENNEYVSGFYLLRLSGLSEFVEFPFIGLSPSVYYQVVDNNRNVVIGEDIITFTLVNQDNSYDNVLVYDKSDLSLISELESDSINRRIYSDRCFIESTDGNETTLRFIGKQGVETLIINQTSLDYESNDAQDRSDYFC